MSKIPEHLRDYFLRSKVKWMDYFFRKLGGEAKTDMFGKTPYYAMNQMTKMAIRSKLDCRSDVPGLLAAGLAQAGCANHFAGFHIGLCIGNGWIAGRSAIKDLDVPPAPALNPDSIQSHYDDVMHPLRPSAQAESDGILRELQQIMFAYDVGILKHADRIEQALTKVDALAERTENLGAPHIHELVRLKETEAMLHAARLILGASMFPTESRLSHFRDDFPDRDDEHWAVWVDATKLGVSRSSKRRRSRHRCVRSVRSRTGGPPECAEAQSPALDAATEYNAGSVEQMWSVIASRQRSDAGVKVHRAVSRRRAC